MANIYDLIQQNAELPTNFINSYNAGVQMKRQEEDRQLQRKQLIQQIEGLIQDNRKRKAEATLKEEELGPEATEARKKGRLAETVKAEADIEFTKPERKAGLAQTYAQTEASKASAASSRANAALSNIQRQRQQLQLQTEQATQAGDIAAINATNQQRRQLAEMTTQLLSDPSYKDLWSEAQRGQLVGQAIASRTELLSQQAESSKLVRQLSEDGVAIATLPIQQKQAVIQAEAAIQQAKEFLENGDVRSAENTAKHMEAIVKSAVASATLPQVKQRLQLELEKLLSDIDKSKAEAEYTRTTKGRPDPTTLTKLERERDVLISEGDFLGAMSRQGRINNLSNQGPTESVRTDLQKQIVAIDDFADAANRMLNTDLTEVGAVSDIKSSIRGFVSQLKEAGVPDNNGTLQNLKELLKDPTTDIQRAGLAALAIKLADTLPGAERSSAGKLIDLANNLMGSSALADPQAVRQRIGTFLADAYERKFRASQKMIPDLPQKLPPVIIRGRETFLQAIREGKSPEWAKERIYEVVEKNGYNPKLLGIE